MLAHDSINPARSREARREYVLSIYCINTGPKSKKAGAVVHATVPECIDFNRLELSLSGSRSPDLLEMLVVRRNGWSRWSRVLCAQGGRALKHFAPS